MSKSNKATKQTTAPANTTVSADPVDNAKKELVGLPEGTSKSAMIRLLAGKEYSRSTIAKALDIRYQHVRNVLETPLKRTAETKTA